MGRGAVRAGDASSAGNNACTPTLGTHCNLGLSKGRRRGAEQRGRGVERWWGHHSVISLPCHRARTISVPVSLLQDGQHLPCAAAVAARRCSCVVLAPTSPSLSAWETLIPLVVSSHVLLDIKTFPVKNHFRLLLYWLMQLLTNKICMDCVLMASFACFNRFSLLWLSFLILFSSFQLAEDKHSGWVASYRVSALPGRRWRTPITTVKCCMAIQTQLFSPFGDEHVSIEQRVRSEGVHRNLLTCGWLPSSLRIPTARLQSS